jgi:hypothetical protein
MQGGFGIGKKNGRLLEKPHSSHGAMNPQIPETGLSGNCDCNYIPRMWEAADMGDVAALIAPRPLLIETARQDPLNGPRGMANVFEQYAVTEQAYKLLDAPARLTHDTFDGGHVWHGTVAFDWLDRWLKK